MAVKTEAKVKVTIEAAGDHSFDLKHIRRQGAVDLVATLLEAAGVDRRKKWRLRVDEKTTCTSHTMPVSVTISKPWCVYIRIKPGDNNTSHRCSLLVPDGSNKGYSKELCDRLKLVEQTVNDEWRSGKRRIVSQPEEEETIPTPVAAPLEAIPEAVEEVTPVPAVAIAPATEEHQVTDEPRIEEPEKFNASKILRDPEQIRNVLICLHKISKQSNISTRDQFMDAMRRDMKWEEASKHGTGAIVSSLLKADYLMQVLDGTKIVGYALDDKGKRLIQDLIEKHEAEKAAKHAPAKPTISTTKVLKSLGKVGEWFNTASKRLGEIEAEREMLLEQVANLNAEEKAICAMVEDPKTQAVLAQLTEVEIKHT